MSSLDRVVETVSVMAIVGKLLDVVREMNEKAAEVLPEDWVAVNGPHAPMEQLKEGMLSVHTEWQSLQADWRTLQNLLYSKKATTDSVEHSLTLLAGAAVKMILDLKARSARQQSVVVDKEEVFCLSD